MTPDVNVVLLDFHKRRGHEMVVENEDGSFTIMINSRLSYQGQLDAYYHAMSHIENGDFQKDSVQAIEAAAHAAKLPDTTERIPAEEYLERLKALRAQRRSIQRQLRKIEADMESLKRLGAVNDFTRAEQQWLYGKDL